MKTEFEMLEFKKIEDDEPIEAYEIILIGDGLSIGTIMKWGGDLEFHPGNDEYLLPELKNIVAFMEQLRLP